MINKQIGSLDSKEQFALNVNNYLNTNIYSYLETYGGQISSLYVNVVRFLTPVLIKHLSAQDCCFPALVSNMHCSILKPELSNIDAIKTCAKSF
jgi:hypothetical protein